MMIQVREQGSGTVRLIKVVSFKQGQLDLREINVGPRVEPIKPKGRTIAMYGIATNRPPCTF
jgi:hypothetical protein